MKPCYTIYCVTTCGVIAIVMQMVAICMTQWWHAPAYNATVSEKGTFYQMRGLWKYDSEKITKFKEHNKAELKFNETMEDIEVIREDVPAWFDALRALETISTIGILALLGIIIMVAKTDSSQIAWGPSVGGFGAAFCILAASFIRWHQQEEFAYTY
ncbi:uncharacterized protein LOC115223585 [Argonauta hians]